MFDTSNSFVHSFLKFADVAIRTSFGWAKAVT